MTDWACAVPGHAGMARADGTDSFCAYPGCMRTSDDPARRECACDQYECAGGCCGPGQCSCWYDSHRQERTGMTDPKPNPIPVPQPNPPWPTPQR